jgi:hypothetical protein
MQMPPKFKQEIAPHLRLHPCKIVNVISIVASTFGSFQQLVCKTFKKSNETTYMQSFTKIWWTFACACFHAFCAQASMKNHQVYLCVQVFTKKMTTTLELILLGMMTWWLIEFKPIHTLIKIWGLTFGYLDYSYWFIWGSLQKVSYVASTQPFQSYGCPWTIPKII